MVFLKRPLVVLRALFEMSMINVTPDAQPIRPALVRRHPGLRHDVANRRVSGSLAPVWLEQTPDLPWPLEFQFSANGNLVTEPFPNVFEEPLKDSQT